MGTLTHDPHGFTHQKNIENGGEMAEIHQILMIFMKLAISQSVLHQKICSWTCFVGGRYVNLYPYPDQLLPVPRPVSTHTCNPHGYAIPMHLPNHRG